MFEYIKAKIVELTPAYVIVDHNNMGYFIHISLHTYSGLHNQEDVIIYLHQIIKEDAHLLYGFHTREEREVFRQLITVSGIGANIARVMLSSLTPGEVKNAIVQDDINRLKSVKGIGAKTAQRIVIDLKDKLSLSEKETEIFTPADNTMKEESLSALVMLGFQKSTAEKAIDRIIAEEKDITTESLIKKALNYL